MECLYRMTSIGQHLIIEAEGDIASISLNELEDITQRAAQSTGATMLSSHFHPFGEGLGVTGVVVLAESHMTVHTWPERQYAAFDIFVCGVCDPHKAVETLRQAHPESRYDVRALPRGAIGAIDEK